MAASWQAFQCALVPLLGRFATVSDDRIKRAIPSKIRRDNHKGAIGPSLRSAACA
jgi:hypothetical protein